MNSEIIIETGTYTFLCFPEKDADNNYNINCEKYDEAYLSRSNMDDKKPIDSYELDTIRGSICEIRYAGNEVIVR